MKGDANTQTDKIPVRQNTCIMVSFSLSHIHSDGLPTPLHLGGGRDRQTDRQADRQTDRQNPSIMTSDSTLTDTQRGRFFKWVGDSGLLMCAQRRIRVLWVSAKNSRIMDYWCAHSAELAEHAKFGEKTDNTECHKLGEKSTILSTDKMEFGKK